MGLLVGLLVVAMVQVSFLFSIVVGGCGQMWGLWVDVDVNVEVSFCYDFYFLFLLVVVVVWVVGFWWVVGSVVLAVL